MSDNANSRKGETGVKSFINTLKNRFGILRHAKGTEPQRLEALLSEVEQEVRLETSDNLTGHACKTFSTHPKRAEDTVMQQQWAHEELKIVNLAIERKYGELRSLSLDDREEALCVETIHKLEMRRLNLMTMLHGQDINGYVAAR